MNTRKNIVKTTGYFLAVILLVLTVASPIITFAYDPIVFTVTSASGTAGTDVAVSLNISGNSGLAAVDFILTYDSTKLTFKSADLGSAASGPNMNSAINGTKPPLIRHSFIAMNGLTAAGSMMDVIFTIKEGWTGSTPLTLTHGPLHDKDANLLSSTIVNGSVTLAVPQQTVSFNANGGSYVPPVTQDVGTQVAAPAINPTKLGHTFSGWYTNAGLTIPVNWPYTLGASDVTFHAKWTANTYTVNYNPSGGTGTTAASQHTYGVTSNLTSNNFSKIGHDFSGWSTTPGGGVLYTNAQSVLNLTATSNDIVTFYAVWALKQFEITFNTTGGSAVATITQYYGSAITPPGNPSKEGYTFNKWLPAVPETMPATDTACVAQWDINEYTISFDSDGGTSVAGITQDYNTAVTAPTAPTKEGYTFAGWLPDVPAFMPSYDLTCTAKWTLNDHQLTVNPNGGTWEIFTTPQNYTQNYNTTKTIADPTRTGYNFTGWSLGTGQGSFNAATKTYTFGPTLGSTATLTAQWAIKTYTITFELNGGNGTSSWTRPYGHVQATLPIPTRTNYNFDGWYAEAGLINKVEAPYTVLGDVTLYAKWSASGNFMITFDANGGTGGAGPTSMVAGTPLTAPAVMREGYLLAGWLPALPVNVPGEDTTYTAQWIQTGTEVTVTKGVGEMIVNIKSWTADTQYQIWSNQSVKSDTLLDGVADVKTDQWILSQSYMPGSAGIEQPDGSINFIIDEFDSPDKNYTIAVRVADAGYNFLREVRDAYTPLDVGEVVITKVLVDGVYAKETEIKEIKDGANVLMSVICNKDTGVTYSATASSTIKGSTVTQPVDPPVLIPNTNRFNWDISDLSTGTYTVILKAQNSSTSDTQEVQFQLYSSTEGINYGTINSMELTATGKTIKINPAFMNGSFWYRIGESGKPPIVTSGLIQTAGNIEYTVAQPGIYQVFGFVNRTGVTLIGNAYDDAYVRTIEIARTAPVVIPDPDPDPVTITFNANGGQGGTAGNQIPGKPITAPTLTRAGFVFNGWNPPLPATVPEVATTYTAQWININDLPAAITITFNANGGTGDTANLQIPGRPMTAPSVTRDGYVLDGWVPALPATVPALPTTYTAQWKLAPGPVDPPSSKVTLAANRPLANVPTGTAVTFTASANIINIGDTSVQYSFWRYDAKGWVLVKDWSLSNTLTWTPARVGDYTIQVRAKGTNAGSYEALSNVDTTVTDPDPDNKKAQVSNISINQAQLNSDATARTPIAIRASATSTNGQALLYKFYVHDSAMGTTTLQNYSVNQQCVWIPRKAGDYTISVLVKSSASFGKYDAIQAFDITVN